MEKIQQFAQFLRDILFRRLEAPRRNYEKIMINNMDNLHRVIRKGDIILVEGNSEINIIEDGEFNYKTLWAQTNIESPRSRAGQTTARKDPDREPIPA